MVDNDRGHITGSTQYDQRRKEDIFDEDNNLVEQDVESIQEPYPVNDMTEDEGEVENPDENREYEDKDHPHEYNPPRAVVDVEYSGVSDNDGTNAYDQQNPLQSTIPASERDR